MEKKKTMTTPTTEERAKVEDLNSLLNLNFGPEWASGSASKNLVQTPSEGASKNRTQEHKEGRGRQDRSHQRDGGGRERRHSSLRETRKRSGPHSSGRYHEERQGSKAPYKKQAYSKPFTPIAEIAFQPKEEMFRALVKIMRESCRTFELFSVARTMLQKSERYQIIIRPLRKDQEPEKKQKLYVSVPDRLPFLTQTEALDHIISNHLELFFELETVDAEPPKGNFPCVNKCGITGVLLGPPNYHLYKDTLREHFTRRINNMSFERFTSKIETVRDEETVQKWVEKMSKTIKFKVKTTEEGAEPNILDTHEEVRKYLLEEAQNKAIKEVNQARLDGEKLAQLPKGDLSLSVITVLEQQKRFPLDTANILRDRFRHQRFSIYKKGSKGISYVCAIKRKHRTPDTVFAASMQDLIAFIETNPRVLRSNLPEQHLKTSESEVSEEKTSTMLRDLHWLISEGYVSEFEDGALYISPIQNHPQSQAISTKKRDTYKKEEEQKKTPSETSSSKEQEQPKLKVSEATAINATTETATATETQAEETVTTKPTEQVTVTEVKSISEQPPEVNETNVEKQAQISNNEASPTETQPQETKAPAEEALPPSTPETPVIESSKTSASKEQLQETTVKSEETTQPSTSEAPVIEAAQRPTPEEDLKSPKEEPIS